MLLKQKNYGMSIVLNVAKLPCPIIVIYLSLKYFIFKCLMSEINLH